MSGVIDAAGVQWERCNACGDWERIDELAFAPDPDRPELGKLDLCRFCAHPETTPAERRARRMRRQLREQHR